MATLKPANALTLVATPDGDSIAVFIESDAFMLYGTPGWIKVASEGKTISNPIAGFVV